MRPLARHPLARRGLNGLGETVAAFETVARVESQRQLTGELAGGHKVVEIAQAVLHRFKGLREFANLDRIEQ